MTAHATEFATDGTFADASAQYYAERARGGVGVITMEAMAVHPTSLPRRGVIHAYDPGVVESYRRVVDAVHPHGALLLAQLWHRGRQADAASGQQAAHLGAERRPRRRLPRNPARDDAP